MQDCKICCSHRALLVLTEMRSPAHVLALEMGLIDELLNRRGRCSELSGIFEDISSCMTRRHHILVKKVDDFILSPSPSYTYMMNDELYGVYPTPTGLNIRKPLLIQGDEDIILQPGFEDNRKLIIYDLQATHRPGLVSEVSGLPAVSQCCNRKFDMAANNRYLVILISTGHLFYIVRERIRDSCQAFLWWNTDGTLGRCDHLIMGTQYPYQIRVVTAARHEMYVVDVLLDERHERLRRTYEYFPRRDIGGFGYIDKPLTSVIPIVPGIFGVIVRDESTMSSKASCTLCLADSRFRQIGSCSTKVAMDGKEVYHMQILDGPKDTIYVVRRDTSFKEQARFTERDYNQKLPRVKSSDSIISDVCPDDPKRLAVYVVHWY